MGVPDLTRFFSAMIEPPPKKKEFVELTEFGFKTFEQEMGFKTT